MQPSPCPRLLAAPLPSGSSACAPQRVQHGTLALDSLPQLAGQNETCPALLTLPDAYLDAAVMQPVGLVLAHARDADSWQSGLMAAVAAHFAARGHVVARYYCRAKEQRRLRIFERTLDAAATCPLARAVRRWVLLGFDNGARIAAAVAVKPRPSLAGLILVSYPLLDPQPPPPKQKAGAAPPSDSMGPLLKLSERQPRLPMLFITGELDPLCPTGRLKQAAEALAGQLDMRAAVLEVRGRCGCECAPGVGEGRLCMFVPLGRGVGGPSGHARGGAGGGEVEVRVFCVVFCGTGGGGGRAGALCVAPQWPGGCACSGSGREGRCVPGAWSGGLVDSCALRWGGLVWAQGWLLWWVVVRCVGVVWARELLASGVDTGCWGGRGGLHWMAQSSHEPQPDSPVAGVVPDATYPTRQLWRPCPCALPP